MPRSTVFAMIVPVIGARTSVSSSWMRALSTDTCARTTCGARVGVGEPDWSCSCSVIDWLLNSSSARRFWLVALASLACATSRSACAWASVLLRVARIDANQRRTALDQLAGLRDELENLARGLGLDLDRGIRLNGAGRLGRDDDVALLHRHRAGRPPAAPPSCTPRGASTASMVILSLIAVPRCEVLLQPAVLQVHLAPGVGRDVALVRHQHDRLPLLVAAPRTAP